MNGTCVEKSNNNRDKMKTQEIKAEEDKIALLRGIDMYYEIG